MKGICFRQIITAVFFGLVVNTCVVESFVCQQDGTLHYLISVRQSSTRTKVMIPRNADIRAGSPRKILSPPPSLQWFNRCYLYAARGNNENNNKSRSKKPPMVGYNDDAFGLIFLSGGLLSQDVDFVVTFVTLSAIAAIFASNNNSDTRLPGLVAMTTLGLTPIVAYLHATIVNGQGMWTVPQPVEIGLCLVSLVWSFVKWTQEQNE